MALIDARPSLLEFVDHQLIEDFIHQLRDRGMAIRLGWKVARIEFEHGATELIDIGQAVVNLQGTLDYFIENTFNYPPPAEAYKIAVLDAWNRMMQV